MLLFASLTETPPEVIRHLPLRDVKRLQKAFEELSGEDFLG
ncbi:MAG TPA: phage tail assembly protein [Candidatus Competibacteraceae bacterium]|nr:phage tail assembly protein [Candidatus Competibacteraceae bacterium]